MFHTGQYDMTVYSSFISHEGSGSKIDLWRENTLNEPEGKTRKRY